MSRPLGSLQRPLRRIGTAMLVMLSLLLVNLAYTQVIKASDYASNPLNRRTQLADFNRQRGQISAAGGVVLASSVPSDDQFRYQRSYPRGAAFANLTGYLSLRYGKTGLESSQNALLSGDDPALTVTNLSDLVTGRDPRGANVELTVVPKLQQVAYDQLASKNLTGAVVALQPKTGAVLAMVTSPSFNPNPLASHSTDTQREAYNKLREALTTTAPDPTVNRAIESVYPPGSTFKLVVSAAALQNGFTPNSAVTGVNRITLPGTRGATLSNYGGETCGNGGGSDVTLTQALAHSCNTAFAEVAMKVGAAKLKEQAAAFGVGEPATIAGLPGATSRVGDLPDQAAVAQSGIGQRDVAFSPMQNAEVVASIANAGQRMQPYLVSRVTKPDLSLLSSTEPTSMGQAVPAEVAGQIRDMMRESEKDLQSSLGLGRLAQYDIASKTGTAEHGADPKTTPPHAWYVAFAPATDPQIAVAVFVADGGDRGLSATGASVAGPVGHAVIAAALGAG